MLTQGLRNGQLDEVTATVNEKLRERGLAEVTRQNVSYHVPKVNKKSRTLTGDIIRAELRFFLKKNELEVQEVTNSNS